jgi:tetratricopeptide (TPR) repeat protein
MEKKMTYLKFAAIVILFSLMIACGGTKNEEIDYSQITDLELMQMADTKMEAGDYDNAIIDYNRLLLDFPTSNLHIDVQIKIAEAYGKLDKFEDQMNQLHRLVKENIIPERVPQIYVQLGKWYERAAMFNPGIETTDSVDYGNAITHYDNALNYPDSDDNKSKSEAVYRRALVEAKIGLIDEAIGRYGLVSSLFPNSEFSILSQIKLKDPSNTSELVTTDSAMTVYKLALGIIDASTIEDQEDAEEEEEEKDEEESSLESAFDPVTEDEQQADETGDQEEDVEENQSDNEGSLESTIDLINQDEDPGETEEENNESENQEEETVEPAEEELFTPAVEDSSDNR